MQITFTSFVSWDALINWELQKLRLVFQLHKGASSLAMTGYSSKVTELVSGRWGSKSCLLIHNSLICFFSNILCWFALIQSMYIWEARVRPTAYFHGERKINMPDGTSIHDLSHLYSMSKAASILAIDITVINLRPKLSFSTSLCHL